MAPPWVQCGACQGLARVEGWATHSVTSTPLGCSESLRKVRVRPFGIYNEMCRGRFRRQGRRHS